MAATEGDQHSVWFVGNAPQPLLAGNNDLGVLGDLGLDLAKEVLVGNHVAAAQPPAAQAKVGGLLQKVDHAPLCLGDVDGNLDGTLHSGLHTADPIPQVPLKCFV